LTQAQAVEPSGAPILLAAGGTAGHLFPAEALAAALARRGITVELATDARAAPFAQNFPAKRLHVIPSATLRGRDPLNIARTAASLGWGTLQSWMLLRQIRPRAVVGFGGYPTIPPVMAAVLANIPTLIHEQNGVMGRANRLLAPRVRAIATGFPGVVKEDSALAKKTTITGDPIRQAVIDAAALPYPELDPLGPLRLLVFGGSQGARIMADIVPPALERLDPRTRSRLIIMQQARDEDFERVRSAYAALGLQAEVASFFKDLPARIAASHLVVSRSGASTVAEVAAIGRPAIFVPLPHALDQDQLANARVLANAGAAVLLPQAEFTPERLASEIAKLAEAPDRLVDMVAKARSIGRLDAADRLAELVLRVAYLAKGASRDRGLSLGS
jgi:UDP-N-acetylglucosamine--N-acetylmuramyl-(pentapeptide) pyrophosphoryl-undecaprenol N-acetylglucosamine transferase